MLENDKKGIRFNGGKKALMTILEELQKTSIETSVADPFRKARNNYRSNGNDLGQASFIFLFDPYL